MKRILAALLFTLTEAFAQTTTVPCADVAAIQQYVDTLASKLEKSPQRKFEKPLFPESSKWREIKEWNVEGKIDDAIVFFDRSAPMTVLLQFNSEDHTLFAYYYFRPDGTLAKREEQLNTFNGEITALRDVWVSCDGKQLKSTKKYFILGSKTETTPGPNFIDRFAPLCRSVRDLPFYPMLQRPAQGKRK